MERNDSKSKLSLPPISSAPGSPVRPSTQEVIDFEEVDMMQSSNSSEDVFPSAKPSSSSKFSAEEVFPSVRFSAAPRHPFRLPVFLPTMSFPRSKDFDNKYGYLDILPDPVCVVDLNGGIIAMNSLFLNLAASHAECKSVFQLWNTDNDAFFLLAIKEIQSSPGPSSRLLSVDEKSMHCEWILSGDAKHSELVLTARLLCSNVYYNKYIAAEELRTAEEEMINAFAINAGEHLEKTKRMTLEQLELDKELIKSQALSDMLESKRLVVRTVSHEMRTPLNIATTGIQVLLRECKLLNAGADLMDVIHDIDKACATAVEILSDLLTYEKIEGGVQKLELAELPIEEVILPIINQFRPQSTHKSLSMSFVNHFSTVTGVSRPVVLIDRTKLNMVLRNIVSNAIKFSRKGGTIFAELMLLNVDFDEKAYVRFQVKDSGPGISREDQLKLFRDIVQFKPNELQNGGGSGLGLWISRGIMDLHDGRIGVFSEGEGHGCTFYIDLELIRYAEPRLRRRSSSVDRCDAPSDEVTLLSKLPSVEKKPHGSILLVDDSTSSRKMAKRALLGAFSLIDEAEDGLQALILVAQSVEDGNPFSIVLMDSNMPKLRGSTAADCMRRIGFKGKIFGLTGNSSQEETDEYLSSGADFVFVKPLNSSSLHMIANFMAPELAH